MATTLKKKILESPTIFFSFFKFVKERKKEYQKCLEYVNLSEFSRYLQMEKKVRLDEMLKIKC